MKPKRNESKIQTACEQILQVGENMGKIAYQKNNSGAFKTPHGSFVRFGKKGAPDFLVFCPNGVTLHLEVKDPQGKQSETQIQYQQHIEYLGHEYHVVHSADEMIEVLCRFSTLREWIKI